MYKILLSDKGSCYLRLESGLLESIKDLLLMLRTECLDGDTKLNLRLSVGSYELVMLKLDNVTILACDDTGNSLELFGKDCIGVFDYDPEHTGRIVKDVHTKCPLTEKDIIGFENHAGHIEGMGDFIIEGEFLGTYIIGPILVRNPELCKYFVHKLIGAKDPAHTYLNEDYAYEEEAYNKTVNAE